MNMAIRIFVLFFLLDALVFTNAHQAEKGNTYKTFENAAEIFFRMIHLMQTLHHDGRERHTNLNRIRFFYEQTPYYELGYIMGEIIERYRKMVNHARRRHTWRSTSVHYLLRKTQTIQNLYFEIYSLCGMSHEVELKYRDTFKRKEKIEETLVDLEKIRADIEKRRIREEIRKKKLLKFMRKVRKNETMFRNFTKTTKRNPWPIDYGWDIGPSW